MSLTFVLPIALTVGLSAAAAPNETVELRGRAVCLDTAGRPEACGTETDRYVFEDEHRQLHPFIDDDALVPVFGDPRVRAQQLIVRARRHPDGRLELIAVYTLHEGVPHDVRYYCNTCNITRYVPGLCPCCRQEMALIETPLAQTPAAAGPAVKDPANLPAVFSPASRISSLQGRPSRLRLAP